MWNKYPKQVSNKVEHIGSFEIEMSKENSEKKKKNYYKKNDKWKKQ